MILIPKPSSCEQDQSGGQVTPDTMDQFWQRRLLVDQLTTAPHVDRMMKLLGDMKQVEGQALPSSLLGQGPNSSDYFRLQGQLKNIPAQPVKRPLPTTASAAAAAAAAAGPRPPVTARSFEEALKESADIEIRLDEYKNKAKQDMEEALQWGDNEAIKKVDYNWWIVTVIIKDLREATDPYLDKPSLVNQLIYGKEAEKRRQKSEKEAHEDRLERLWCQLKDMYPDQKGKGSKATVWQKARGWIQE